MDDRIALISDIDTLLRHHLGQGVDQQRTLVDARYARDVLLVCDGMAGTELPQLSSRFRQASLGSRMPLPVLKSTVAVEAATSPLSGKLRQAGHEAGPPQGWAQHTSGFGSSRPMIADFNLDAHYGTRAREPVVTDRRGHRMPVPDRSTQTPTSPHDTAPPWYSWRRWISEKD